MDSIFFMIIGVILYMIIFGGIGHAIGKSKKREDDGLMWGILLGPLGWIITALLPEKFDWECPYCDMGLKKKSRICHNCHSELDWSGQ